MRPGPLQRTKQVTHVGQRLALLFHVGFRQPALHVVVERKQPIANLMLSNAVRSATTAWAKTLSDQVAQYGITVNCLAPGRIDTERVRQLDEDAAQRQGKAREEVEREALASIPVRRYGRPEEYGAAAAFLASAPAAYITGVTLLVDGGLYRGMY